MTRYPFTSRHEGAHRDAPEQPNAHRMELDAERSDRTADIINELWNRVSVLDELQEKEITANLADKPEIVEKLVRTVQSAKAINPELTDFDIHQKITAGVRGDPNSSDLEEIVEVSTLFLIGDPREPSEQSYLFSGIE